MEVKSAYLEQLQRYIENTITNSAQLTPDRNELIGKIADSIVEQLTPDKGLDLNFICTHNSRRSHFSQVWCQVALMHYGIENIRTWSGGTEVTQCNPRTASALVRAGFELANDSSARSDENPIYQLRFADAKEPIECFSKLYNSPPNPQENFFAMLCCSDVDEKCPVISGSTNRFGLHYRDPKYADSTPEENQAYDSCCQEIACEMFALSQRLTESLE